MPDCPPEIVPDYIDLYRRELSIGLKILSITINYDNTKISGLRRQQEAQAGLIDCIAQGGAGMALRD